MQSLWNDQEANKYKEDPLQLRVYSSRLLGQAQDLVLHGGGNTSVKIASTNIFGEIEDLLYVKGSGWDLATIESAGFTPVKLEILKKMVMLDTLSDKEMMRLQRSATTNPFAPDPSVEAILHALIPFKYVDHTHADAVVTITNTSDGEEKISRIYGKKVMIIPYVMPGFILAKKVFELIKDIKWDELEGIILMNHGVFTFGVDAKSSYERMIKIVLAAEKYLEKYTPLVKDIKTSVFGKYLELARLRKAVSNIKGAAMIAKVDTSPESVQFSDLPNVKPIAVRGPLTPDHVIRTKRIPVIIQTNYEKDVEQYAEEYQKYFERNTNGQLTCLDKAPRWAVWPKYGNVAFGQNVKEAKVVSDIMAHTVCAIQYAENMGGWKALPEKDIFNLEYWELEQAKLGKQKTSPLFQGKIVLVTGAARGIGRACVEAFYKQGAAVVALDKQAEIKDVFNKPEILEVICDVTDREQIKKAVELTIREFGGLDILISNAGIFPKSEEIVDMNQDNWNRSLAINLSSHQFLIQTCIPYLSLGIDPAIVIIASKNVLAPGPGAAAYSVAKAGLTQLARIAALELGSRGIRVNVIHPHGIFDTALWTPAVLKERAQHYAMSVDEYKTNNVLKVEIKSEDVANLACSMAGPVFSKTTGAQVPIDGGNERVI